MCAAFVFACDNGICGCFVYGVCIHGLDVVEEAYRDLLELVCNVYTTWEPGVEGYLAMGKFPA